MIRKTSDQKLEIIMECTEEEFSEMLLSFMLSQDGEKYLETINAALKIKNPSNKQPLN